MGGGVVKFKKILTAERLRQLYSYDPATGNWRDIIDGTRKFLFRTRWGAKQYRTIAIDGVLYRTSRLAYLFMTGEWPAGLFIDHIDRDVHHEAWANLRPATPQQNSANQSVRRRKKQPLPKGVSLNSSKTAYIARICFKGNSELIGTFATVEEADVAYRRRAVEIHGHFAYSSVEPGTPPPKPISIAPAPLPEQPWLPEGRIVCPPGRRKSHLTRIGAAIIKANKNGKVVGDRQEKQARWFRSF